MCGPSYSVAGIACLRVYVYYNVTKLTELLINYGYIPPVAVSRMSVFQVKCFVLFDTFGMEFRQAILSWTMINDTSLVFIPRGNNYH